MDLEETVGCRHASRSSEKQTAREGLWIDCIVWAQAKFKVATDDGRWGSEVNMAPLLPGGREGVFTASTSTELDLVHLQLRQGPYGPILNVFVTWTTPDLVCDLVDFFALWLSPCAQDIGHHAIICFGAADFKWLIAVANLAREIISRGQLVSSSAEQSAAYLSLIFSFRYSAYFRHRKRLHKSYSNGQRVLGYSKGCDQCRCLVAV